MDDAAFVCVGQPLRHLHRDTHCLPDRNGPACQLRRQGLPLQELEHQVGALLAEPQFEERYDVGVRELRCRLGLLQQPLLAQAGPLPGPDSLEGHLSPQRSVLRFEDHSEASAA